MATASLNLTHYLLIASPRLHGSKFAQGVIYICQHDRNGAMGIVLNQPYTASKFKDLLNHMKINYTENLPEQIVISGGPVQTDHGFVLHSPVGQWRTSRSITPEIAVTTSRDILVAMAEQKNAPQQSLVALGCAGWKPGQLDAEVRANDWLLIQASKDFIFNTPPQHCWKKAIQLIGIKHISQLAPYAGHA